MIPNDVLLYSCFAQPSSEKVPPAVDGDKYRDPQLGNVQRGNDFETLSPKWTVFIKSLPSGLKELCGRGSRKTVRASDYGGNQGNKAMIHNSIHVLHQR